MSYQLHHIVSPGLLLILFPLRYHSPDARCRPTALPLSPTFENPAVAPRDPEIVSVSTFDVSDRGTNYSGLLQGALRVVEKVSQCGGPRLSTASRHAQGSSAAYGDGEPRYALYF